eukprot:2109696-Lingulodinium_polyedra.AAC.1
MQEVLALASELLHPNSGTALRAAVQGQAAGLARDLQLHRTAGYVVVPITEVEAEVEEGKQPDANGALPILVAKCQAIHL